LSFLFGFSGPRHISFTGDTGNMHLCGGQCKLPVAIIFHKRCLRGRDLVASTSTGALYSLLHSRFEPVHRRVAARTAKADEFAPGRCVSLKIARGGRDLHTPPRAVVNPYSIRYFMPSDSSASPPPPRAGREFPRLICPPRWALSRVSHSPGPSPRHSCSGG
jgi:hypothetical protein